MFTAQGVTRTWDGGGADNNWNTPANWSGDTVPTSSDTAVFDSTSTKNCTINVTLSGGTAPAGLSINTGYTGTITQASGVSVTIGSSGFSQAVGTFTGGDSAITINGTYTLSGGTFTSTSGTMTISNNFTHTAGGTFNHNSGTVNFSFGAITLTVDVATSETFNNLTIICTDNYTLAIASGDTLIVLGTLTHTEGVINTGTIEARGNVSIASTADGGSGTISFLTSGDQTITGNSGSTCRLNIAKSSGTVSMGSTNLSITGLTLSSGTLTSTSGTLTITTNSAGTQSFTHTAGGTFNHNNGTVVFTKSFNNSLPIDVATSETFYNLTVNMVSNYNLDIASGDTIVVLGTFTHTDGYINTGTIEVRGNAVLVNTSDGGSCTLSFLIGGDQTITGNGGNTCRLNVAKSSGTLSAGTSFLGIAGLTLSSGTFVSTSGTLVIKANSAGTQSFTHTAGGTFNHNSGTVTFSNGFLSAIPIDVATSETFYNLTISMVDNYPVNIASGDSLIVLGTFTYTDGRVETGTVEARGNVVVASTADGGSSLLSFTGTSDQTYTDQGGNEPNGNVTINKPVGTKVTLASNADWNAASQAVTITSGILDIASYNLYTGGTLTVGASGVLHDYSTGDIILGGNVSNSGIIRLESSGSCGSTDSISITSSSGGTQRAWSGSGIYTLWDTSIQDQGGTAKIQVNSGTSVSGNGTNFVFNSGCNFANNTGSLTSGLVGYWPMEENSGTSTADMSGQGNNGTLTNGPTWTTGKIGNTVSFDGNNDYIDLGTSYNNLSSMTVSYWIKLNSLPSSSYMPIAKSASWGVWRTAISSSGSVTYVVQTTNNVWYSAGTSANSVASAVQVGQWTLVTGTYDGSYVRVYVNGVLKGTGSQAISGNIYDANPQSVYIGHQDYGQFTQGAIDEVRIYNRALSATEVQQLYNNVRPSAVSIPSSKITIPSGKVNFAY